MENSTPKDRMDAEILRLRASVTASRKLLDDINGEVTDQAKIVQHRGVMDSKLFWYQGARRFI